MTTTTTTTRTNAMQQLLLATAVVLLLQSSTFIVVEAFSASPLSMIRFVPIQQQQKQCQQRRSSSASFLVLFQQSPIKNTFLDNGYFHNVEQQQQQQKNGMPQLLDDSKNIVEEQDEVLSRIIDQDDEKRLPVSYYNSVLRSWSSGSNTHHPVTSLRRAVKLLQWMMTTRTTSSSSSTQQQQTQAAVNGEGPLKGGGGGRRLANVVSFNTVIAGLCQLVDRNHPNSQQQQQQQLQQQQQQQQQDKEKTATESNGNSRSQEKKQQHEEETNSVSVMLSSVELATELLEHMYQAYLAQGGGGDNYNDTTNNSIKNKEKINNTLIRDSSSSSTLSSSSFSSDSNNNNEVEGNDTVAAAAVLDGSGPTTVTPEYITLTYNLVLKAWKTMSATTTAAGGTNERRNSPNNNDDDDDNVATKAAKRGLQLLQQLQDHNLADTISYTTVIGILANTGEKAFAVQANELVEYMLSSSSSSASSSLTSNIGPENDEPQRSSSTRPRSSSSSKRTITTMIEPNVQTLNSVLNAWVRCGNVKRAEQVLKQMETWQVEGKTHLAPNVVSYSTVMNGWSKSRDKEALQRAEETYTRMKQNYETGTNNDARPNLFIYVNLINTYAKQSALSSSPNNKNKNDNAAQKAQDALFRMYSGYKEGNNPDLKPNTQLVTTVMDCWQRSGKNDACEKAESLLDWLLTLYEESGHADQDLCPNEYTFASAIAAWGKSRRFGKAVRARKLLNRMVELYESGKLSARPNTHCYTAVINSCAYSVYDPVEKSTALKIAIATYKELCASKYGQAPNKVTFLALLTALRNLLPPGQERTTAVQTVFRNAAREGHVDDLVIRRVQSALTREELRDLLSDQIVPQKGEEIRTDKVPKEWRRNVAQFTR